MQCWLQGINWVEKCAKATGMTTSLRILSEKPIQTLERASQGVNWSWSQCIKSHHAQTSSGKELPSHFWNRNIIRSILPGLRRKITVAQWSKVLFSDESTFCISFGNQGPRVWRKSGEAQHPCCLKSSVKFPQSVMIWAAETSACVCWFSEVYSQRSHLPGNLRALHVSFCWQALWRCWFPFPVRLGTCPHCQKYQSWFNDHGVTVLDWPANSPDLKPIENLDERHQTQQCRWAEGRYQSDLGFITPEQCHRLITSMPRRIDAVIHAKGGPTKYWVHRNEHTFQKPDISV